MIAVVGSEQTGRSTLIRMFLGKKTNEYIAPTILNEGYYYTNNIQIWDMSGKQHLAYLRQPILKKAKVILLCFDLHQQQSFLDLESRWIPELTPLLHERAKVLLVGCKSDLVSHVSRDQIQSFLTKYNLIYFQTNYIDVANALKPFLKAIPLCTHPTENKVTIVEKKKKRWWFCC